MVGVTASPTPFPDERLAIVPANEASWEDLLAIFGTRDAGLRLYQRRGGSRSGRARHTPS